MKVTVVYPSSSLCFICHLCFEIVVVYSIRVTTITGLGQRIDWIWSSKSEICYIRSYGNKITPTIKEKAQKVDRCNIVTRKVAIEEDDAFIDML